MQNTIDPASLREAITYYGTWLQARQDLLQLPAVQVAVFAEGDIALSRTFGHADPEMRVPLTDRHPFRIASTSKTLAAVVAAFKLVEQGLLGLDHTIEQHLPQLAGTPDGGDGRTRIGAGRGPATADHPRRIPVATMRTWTGSPGGLRASTTCSISSHSAAART